MHMLSLPVHVCPCVWERVAKNDMHMCRCVRAWHLLRKCLTPLRRPWPWWRNWEGGRGERQPSWDSCRNSDSRRSSDPCRCSDSCRSSCRGEQCDGTALFNPAVHTVTHILFSSWSVQFCLTIPLPLCPGAQAHRSSLHPHLRSALQVSASGTERPGTSVSKQTAYGEHFVCTSRSACVALWFCHCVCLSVFLPRLLSLQDENVPTICRGRRRGALKDD